MTFKELQNKGGWVLPPKGHPSSPYKRYEKGLLRPDRKLGFQTPSGKIELYSSLREEWGLEPLAHYEEPPFTPISQPELAKEYPLILNTGLRIPEYTHWQMRNIPQLHRLAACQRAEMHPNTGRDYDIADGDTINIETPGRQIKVKVIFTEDMLPGLISLTHGWEYGSNANVLTRLEPRDPVTGYPELRSLACRIKKCD